MDAIHLPQTAACPDALDETHLAQYAELGYVAFENVLTAAEVESARAALSEITQNLLAEADGTPASCALAHEDG